MTKVSVKTEHKFAVNSGDCSIFLEEFNNDTDYKLRDLKNLYASGASCDFNTDLKFIREVIDRFNLEENEKINWLDLGCAGGKLILDAAEQKETDICIGLDGSVGVYNQESWSSKKNSHILKNADISKPFTILDSKKDKVIFDVITSWEVIEHLYEEDLEQYFNNVHDHLANSGVFIGSIANFPDYRDENGWSFDHPSFNPNGKIYQLHNTLWSFDKWNLFLEKWFNIHTFDFSNYFRNMDRRLTYYFMATKK